MKKIKLTLLFIILTGFLISQTKSTVDNVALIDKQVTTIQNNLPSFQKIVRINTDKGYRYEYIKDKEIQAIQVKSIEPTVEKFVSWYFDNGQMIYSDTQWIDISGNLIFSDKYYLANSHLIHWVKNGQDISSSDPEFKKMDTQLGPYGQKIRQQALQ